MLQSVDQLQAFQVYLLPRELAEELITSGKARPTAAFGIVGPSETKPSSPSEVKSPPDLKIEPKKKAKVNA